MVEIEAGVYALLMPLEIQGEEDDYYVIMKVEEDGDEQILMTIEDDAEYEAVARMIEDFYDAEDEGEQEADESIR